jgi:hypothetical protein
MWMPDWLYERLPTLYVAIAAACLWLLGTSPSTAVSALLLLAASLRTRSLRRRARHSPPPARRHAHPRQPPLAERQGGPRPRVSARPRQ